ncbi:MAG: MFS transporter [Gammaproteobacteria bacterium]|nr:MFS transporter [Gammaproteobacteria bacterium]
MQKGSLWFRRPVLGWALYDWANSAFALSIMTTFVPVLLGEYWNDGAESAVTTFRLGMANGIASLAVALLAPVIGAIADRAGRRKRSLLLFTALGLLMTGSMYFVTAGQWQIALACYVLASIGFAQGNSLYDSLLVDITSAEFYDRVSAYGFALGYLGGALLFSVNVWMVSAPATFGLASAGEAVRLAFLMVAIWWAVFTLPLIFWVHERPTPDKPEHGAIAAGIRELLGTLRAVRQQRDLWIFLIAYWLYIDGVYTIIKMAVDFGLSQGLGMEDLIRAILLTNFIGFPAALLFGYVGDWIGARRGIYVALGVYILTTTAAVFVDTEAEFYVLAAAIGIVQGGVQSLSRSLFAFLIPRDKSGEYFGFYNMLGKFAAIIGPVLTGLVALMTGSQRLGILSILILFVAGLFLLTRVNLPAESQPVETP